jgi:hypothetical protein
LFDIWGRGGGEEEERRKISEELERHVVMILKCMKLL